MEKLFGTDGIRAKANTFPMDCETAMDTGRAIAGFFGKKGKRSEIVIGRDTRISGSMIASALAAGICSMGVNVKMAGIVPTPGLAFIAKTGEFDAGVVISASHNPFYDNGIKLFNGDGFKLSDAAESKIEALITGNQTRSESESIRKTGQITTMSDAGRQYLGFLKNRISKTVAINGLKIVLDGSNGAASHMAPELFSSLGAHVDKIACSPDGININDNCGSQHPEKLAQKVVRQNADIGLAFDGDADRLIAVDDKGTILTGDQIIAVCAGDLKTRGALKNNLVVTTVMSNMGLGAALKKMGIGHLKSSVGDRYVMEKMIQKDAVLGGEDSGHMIFLDHHTTGDGMLAALLLIQAMIISDKPLSELSMIMTVFPQALINVDVASKPDIQKNKAIMGIIESVENRLGNKGRVLVRYSGTQPILRVMVEGPTESETRLLCGEIANIVSKELG